MVVTKGNFSVTLSLSFLFLLSLVSTLFQFSAFSGQLTVASRTVFRRNPELLELNSAELVTGEKNHVLIPFYIRMYFVKRRPRVYMQHAMLKLSLIGLFFIYTDKRIGPQRISSDVTADDTMEHDEDDTVEHDAEYDFTG